MNSWTAAQQWYPIGNNIDLEGMKGQVKSNMITSTANRQVKRVIQLQKKGKLRREDDNFIAEGMKMALEAPRADSAGLYVGVFCA